MITVWKMGPLSVCFTSALGSYPRIWTKDSRDMMCGRALTMVNYFLRGDSSAFLKEVLPSQEAITEHNYFEYIILGKVMEKIIARQFQRTLK